VFREHMLHISYMGWWCSGWCNKKYDEIIIRLYDGKNHEASLYTILWRVKITQLHFTRFYDE